MFFRRDTWHHAFALGPEPLRVLELFAPPPAAGASSALRARAAVPGGRRATPTTRLLGHWPPARRAPPRLRVLRPADVLYRRDLGVLCGILVSTEHLTVATLELGPGEVAAQHAHGGDEVLMALDGPLWVRAWHDGGVHVFELEPEDVCYLPGRQPARVPQRRAAAPRGRSAASPRATCRDASRSASTSGATKIAAARVDVERGAILAARRVPTAPERGPEAVLARLPRAGRASWATARVAVGLAVCELVDPRGRVRSAETVDWRATDLLARFDRGRVRRARGGAGRGALRRRARRARLPLRERRHRRSATA